MLPLTYDALSIKLIETIEVFDGCSISKSKACGVRKKTYTRSTKTAERIFVDTTGPIIESLFGNGYWIGLIKNYILYSRIFFTKTKSQLPKKNGRVF